MSLNILHSAFWFLLVLFFLMDLLLSLFVLWGLFLLTACPVGKQGKEASGLQMRFSQLAISLPSFAVSFPKQCNLSHIC